MRNYRELLFLKELNGVGPVRINKLYVPHLQNGMDIELLIKTVRDNEKKADEENISVYVPRTATLSSGKR